MQSTLPCGTCYPCPGGEDHLKRRSSSPPVPLSLAAGTAQRKTLPAVFAANHRFSPGDARGGAPCIRKLKISPFPAGEGGWGIGGRIKAKGRGQQAARRASPPPGGANAGRASAAPLASPGLTPGGTGEGGKPRARRGLARLGADYPLCVISRDPAYPVAYCPQRSRTRWSDHGSTRALRHRPACRPAGSDCRTSPARCRRFSAEAQDPSQSP